MSTTQAALKPARAKASRPYSAGHLNHDCVILTISGGVKGTGQPIVRAYYSHNRITGDVRNYDGNLPLDVPYFRAQIEARAAKHGYTIVYWPKELRPTS